MAPGDTPIIGPPWFVALGADWFRAMARRGRQPGTRSTYTTPLRHFGKWLEDEGVADPHSLERRHLQEWQDSLIGRVSEKTRSLYSTAIRGLLRFGGREDRIPPGLADWVDPVDVPETEPLVLEPEQLQAALNRFTPPKGDLSYFRDRALFWFLVTSSARINEVLQLDLVHVDRRRWVVTQKGGGEKRLVISTVAKAWLQQYLAVRGRDADPALWIYVGPIVGRRRLNARDANIIWRRLCRELGIPKFTNRWLRGTSATELNELRNTAPDIAHHLGHRNLSTLMKYLTVRENRRQGMVDGLDGLVPALPAPPPRGGRRRGR